MSDLLLGSKTCGGVTQVGKKCRLTLHFWEIGKGRSPCHCCPTNRGHYQKHSQSMSKLHYLRSNDLGQSESSDSVL
jgi:hypothetical protein